MSFSPTPPGSLPSLFPHSHTRSCFLSLPDIFSWRSCMRLVLKIFWKIKKDAKIKIPFHKTNYVHGTKMGKRRNLDYCFEKKIPSNTALNNSGGHDWVYVLCAFSYQLSGCNKVWFLYNNKKYNNGGLNQL